MQKNVQESGHMRLTCPRCGAEYEIAESLIPQQGREVECWACNHVWRQPGLVQGGEFNPDMRPQLNRPLHESILSVLREEAARELEARRTEQQGTPPAPDHVSATEAPLLAAKADPPPPAPISAPTSAPMPDGPLPLAAEAVTTDPAPSPEESAEWPAATITQPPAAEAPTLAPILAPVPSPAAPDDLRTEIAAGQGAHDHQHARHGSITHFDADDFEFPAPPPRPAADLDEARHDPSPATLPDAEALAATLTGPETGPEPEPAPGPGPETDPETGPEPAAQIPSATLTTSIDLPAAALPAAPDFAAQAQALPPPAASRAGGFASGFGLAVMLACAALALYALAPRLSPQDGLLMSWRQEVDRGRLWLDAIIAPDRPAE